MQLIKNIIITLLLGLLARSYAATHHDLLMTNAVLGHSLDKFYYDSGTKVDIIIFDLKELKRQQKLASTKLLKDARQADRQLRLEWLKLEQQRVEIWNERGASLAITAKKLAQLQQKVKRFGAMATKLATELERQTKTIRHGLVYKFNDYPKDWWKKSFIRAVDLSYKIYGIDRYKYPGNYLNIEYVAKAFYDLGLNLISVEASPRYQQQLLEALNQYSGTPFMLWGSDKSFDDKDCISYGYYGDRAKLKKDLLKYVEDFNYRFFFGIQLDEPIIEDNHKRYGEILKIKGIKAAYASYISDRKKLLKSHGIKVSVQPVMTMSSDKNQQALYIEWQLFKKEYMATHYQWLFEMMQQENLFVSTVIMNRNRVSPQMCSYVSMGRIPYIGTDIYQNGMIIESFAVQLLNNSASKRTIFWPGASYSCKTPTTFKRTMATGLIHADGIQMWTYLYCSKYRDANYFWRTGGKTPNMDDRSRITRQNWYPWSWSTMQEMYSLAKAAEPYLGERKSIAQTAILLSEQTLITNAAKRGQIRKYWENNLAIYGALIKANIPVDVCLIESMSTEKLNQYKVLISSNLRATRAADNALLRSWVKQGGTLISSGEISRYDQWGRTKSNYALTELLGADFKGIGKARLNIDFAGNRAEYPGFENYIIAQAHQNIRVVNFVDSKQPGLLINRFGRGISYYFAVMNFGTRGRAVYNGNGLTNPIFSGFGKMISKIIQEKTTLPIVVKHLPEDVEVQIQQSGQNRYVINLLDWQDYRQISGHMLQIKLPGKWRIIYPEAATTTNIINSGASYKLKKFKVYSMIIVKKIITKK